VSRCWIHTLTPPTRPSRDGDQTCPWMFLLPAPCRSARSRPSAPGRGVRNALCVVVVEQPEHHDQTRPVDQQGGQPKYRPALVLACRGEVGVLGGSTDVVGTV
jgi:hypothetical protein